MISSERNRTDRIVYSESEVSRNPREIPRPDDERTPFEIDRSRIIHSAAFRRLQGKTQVFGLGMSDFFRTRLTHSLETAQIGKSLALRLGADPDLVEAACLAHDIGHPPFGHVGELVLKEKMWPGLGFEANAQNLRVLCHIEAKSRLFFGLNLTQATLDAIIKYKVPFKVERAKTEGFSRDAKFYYDDDEDKVSWASEGIDERIQSFESEIMTWADDIAYCTHDLEDGIKSGLVTWEKFESDKNKLKSEIFRGNSGSEWEDAWSWCVEKLQTVTGWQGTEREKKVARKQGISDMVSELIRRVGALPRSAPTNLPPRYSREVTPKPEHDPRCFILKRLVWRMIIADERVATLERKAANIVAGLFLQLTASSGRLDEWKEVIRLFPRDFKEELVEAKRQPGEELYRLACDYIAGMTDAHAIRIYSRLTQPDSESLFEFL